MDQKHETLGASETENKLDPGVQALTDMAGKMGQIQSEPENTAPQGNFKTYSNRVDARKYDENGFDIKNGIHVKTKQRRDPRGFNKDGLYVGEHGVANDKKGYFDPRGFDRTGFNKYTKSNIDLRGFDPDGLYAETGEKYDNYGFDAYGKHREGYRTYHEFLEEWEVDKTRDKDGIDCRGFKKDNTINARTGTKYDENGFDKDGFDSEGKDLDGYDRDGFGPDGFNREGYDRRGRDRYGFPKKSNYVRKWDDDGYNSAGFNKHGVDRRGYNEKGEVDSDVELALNFIDSGMYDRGKFATSQGLSEKEVVERTNLARRKYPDISDELKNILSTGNSMRVATIQKDCNKVLDGSLDINEFWDKHPKLTISEALSNFVNGTTEKKLFSDKTIESMVMDSDSIERNLQIFGASRYDVSSALKGAESFRKIYARLIVDGSPEQIQKKRKNTQKIYDAIKYFNRYRNLNVKSLLGYQQSNDGGKTWIKFTNEAIDEAVSSLKKDKKLVCMQTVRDYILGHQSES